MRDSPWRLRACAALVLVLVAFAAYSGRRAFIRSFFADGSVMVPGERRGVVDGAEVGEVERARVILIDGLGAVYADALPNLRRLCGEGMRLTVDVGFPTVSLPVQHVLWTGRSQQQSGVLYRIPALAQPPVDALPTYVSSRAVAESHPAIVHSFGFGVAEPELDAARPEHLPEGWRGGFAARAIEAVAGPERLVFVHILRVDEAGHAEGAASQAYVDAAMGADAIVAEMLAEIDDPQTRWLLLADHGHLDRGGHGGAEPAIRRVRACLIGAGVEPGSGPYSVTLSEVARLLGESLGVAASRGAVGERWSIAIASPPSDPSPNANPPEDTVPRPSTGRWSAALLALLGILLGLAVVGRRRVWAAFAWPSLAYLGILGTVGEPTLSNPAIYPPVGAALLRAAWPGWLGLGLTLFLLRRDRRPRAALVVLGGAMAAASAALILAGVGGGEPPLIPRWTAQGSAWLTLLWPGALVVAVWLCLPTSASTTERT